MEDADEFYKLASGITTTAYTFSSYVTSGITYSLRVQARNRVGYGNSSTTLEIIAATEPSTPDAPKTANTENGTQVSINWDLPSDNGGLEISGYKIEI